MQGIVSSRSIRKISKVAGRFQHCGIPAQGLQQFLVALDGHHVRFMFEFLDDSRPVSLCLCFNTHTQTTTDTTTTYTTVPHLCVVMSCLQRVVMSADHWINLHPDGFVIRRRKAVAPAARLANCFDGMSRAAIEQAVGGNCPFGKTLLQNRPFGEVLYKVRCREPPCVCEL